MTITSAITISALTSKLLRNSKFSQRHRLFLVFLYQIDTSNDFLFPVFYEFRFLCDYLVFHGENRKISMNKILLFFIFFYFTYTYQISRKSAWKYRFAHRPPNPRSKLETLLKMEKAVTQKVTRFS